MNGGSVGGSPRSPIPVQVNTTAVPQQVTQSPVSALHGAARTFPVLPRSPRATLAQWWNTLSVWGSAKKKCAYFSQEEMASILPDFPCPNNEHTLRTYQGVFSEPINGSRIKLGDDGYQIGQSPTLQTCANALSYSLETGQGLVQIVSDTTHGRKQSTKTLAGMLIAELDKAKANGGNGVLLPTKFSGHDQYYLKRVFEHTKRGSDNKKYFKQYSLVFETQPGNSHTSIVVPLTQIGLPFEGAVLKAADIKIASDIATDEHSHLLKGVSQFCKIGLDMGTLKVANNEGPLLLSKFGHGRNATVVTYQALSKLIKENDLIDADMIREALKKTIETGRAARPHFVHSLAQAEQLQEALELVLQRHEKDRKSPTEAQKGRWTDFIGAIDDLSSTSPTKRQKAIVFLRRLSGYKSPPPTSL